MTKRGKFFDTLFPYLGGEIRTVATERLSASNVDLRYGVNAAPSLQINALKLASKDQITRAYQMPSSANRLCYGKTVPTETQWTLLAC